MVDKLEVVALSKAYRVDGRLMAVLDGVNLRAAEGSFVSIIGPSGCGKSTLFSIIAGLQRPDAGQVLIGGTVCNDRMGQVGYMPQRDLLLPWRRVLDNAILGPEVHGEDVAAARREAQGLLSLFGLGGFGESYPASLSGGMRQRAALLRTFLCRRDVLLLDEPFGALDAITRMDLQEWLQRVWREFRYSVLFITHDVEEAIFLADRVYVLSPRPTRVCLELTVELPRPRSRPITLSPAFAVLKQRVLEALVGTDAAGSA
jgi:ABC-type nitrate/sulfonate/bicarbonate transport system ATPase subunit